MGPKRRLRQLDRAVVALAQRQYGVVAWAQLDDLGMSTKVAKTWVAAGRLHRLHRGVYALGHPLVGTQGHWLAAVFAVGPGAVLSHRSAAALWGLLAGDGRHPDVLVARKLRRRPGIAVHCASSLPEWQVTIRDGIPVTSVARTLVDLAGVVSPRLLERALGQAEVLRLYDRGAIEAILATHPRRTGTATLRRLLAREDLSTVLSGIALEERLLELCDSAGLPRPELNVPFTLPDGTPIRIDALWREARLAVEVDERWSHSTRSAFVRDRRRDAQLTLAGMRPVRLSGMDLTRDAVRTARLLRQLLTAQAPAPPGRAGRPRVR
jgi:hypothetical protein